jgi:hypothetical protein
VTDTIHPYDGKECRFRFDDPRGRARVGRAAARAAGGAERRALRFAVFSSGIAAVCGFTASIDDDHVMYHRQAFQPDYAIGDPIWCEPGSDVNHWGVLWHSNGELGYLGYDQG